MEVAFFVTLVALTGGFFLLVVGLALVVAFGLADRFLVVLAFLVAEDFPVALGPFEPLPVRFVEPEDLRVALFVVDLDFFPEDPFLEDLDRLSLVDLLADDCFPEEGFFVRDFWVEPDLFLELDLGPDRLDGFALPEVLDLDCFAIMFRSNQVVGIEGRFPCRR